MFGKIRISEIDRSKINFSWQKTTWFYDSKKVEIVQTPSALARLRRVWAAFQSLRLTKAPMFVALSAERRADHYPITGTGTLATLSRADANVSWKKKSRKRFLFGSRGKDKMWLRQESNLNLRLRKPPYYPLYYAA